MQLGRMNPVGAVLVGLGALLGLVSIFLPIYQPSSVFSTLQDNSLVQSGFGQGIAIRFAICAIAAGALLWRYQVREKTSWGVMVWGLILAGGAIVDLNTKSNFELVAIDNPSSGVTDTAAPGIAWYLAIAGGLLVMVGGYLVWRKSVPRVEQAEEPANGQVSPEFLAPVLAPSGEEGARARKRCPACAEDVWAEAQVCRFCGHQFSAPAA